MPPLHTQYVAGRWSEPGESHVPSINPFRPDDVIALADQASSTQVTEAVESARAAQPDWERSPTRRTAALHAIAERVRDCHDSLASLIVAEVGKPIGEAQAEAALTSAVARLYAEQLLSATGEVFPTAGPERLLTQRHALGVVGIVTPFNFPLSLAAWKLLPALAYGNTVVWKPAPAAVATAARFTELVGEFLPPGVLNLVFGGAEVVDDLISSVDGVTFTGSTPVGLSIASRCAAQALPVQCEMGGKNATTILADADLDRAVEACVASAFAFGGQKCTATSRLLIDERVWDDVLDRMRVAMDALVIGDPSNDATTVGPLISRRDVERLAQADVHSGPRLIVRPAPEDGDGFFADLAVVGPVSPTDAIATEELFGPLVAAIPVTGLDHAIDITNAAPYGLASALHTRDLHAGLEFAAGVRTGVVRVNRATTGLDYVAPFGGRGNSGFGPKEVGTAARDFFTAEQTVWLG